MDRAQGAQTWVAATWRAGMDFVMVLVVLQMATVAATLIGIPFDRLLSEGGGRLLLIVTEIVVVALLLHTRGHAAAAQRAPAAAALGVMVASVIASQDAGIDQRALHVVMLVGVSPLGLLLVRVSRGLILNLLALAATGPLYIGIWLAFDGTDHLLEVVETWPTAIAFCAAVAVVWPPLYDTAEAADRLDAQIREDALRVAEADHLRRATEESRRVIHDEVIGALRAIELELSRPAMIATARSALGAITSETRPTSSRDDLLTRAADISGLTVTVSDDWEDLPPAHIVRAMSGAVQEALRNVVRHAGVDAAHLALRRAGATYVVEIVDMGTGVTGRAAGFGTSQSIQARLAEIGGGAEIRSGPSGTTVRLSWAPPTDGEANPSQLTDFRPIFLRLAAIGLLSQLLLVARFPGDSTGTSVAVWCATAAVAAATSWYVGSGTPQVAGLFLVTAASAALAVVGMLQQPDGALLTTTWWPIAINLAAPMLYAASMPLRWAVVPMGGMLAAVAGLAAHDPTLGVSQPLGMFATSAAMIGVGAVFGEVLRRGARDATRAAQRHQEQVDELAWHASYDRARRHQERLISRDVVPFLQAVAAGEDMDRAAAALLAEECRDGLYLAQPMPDETRQAIRGARARGIVVTLHVAGYGVEVGHEAWCVLAEVLDAAIAGQVTLRPRGGPDEDVEISAAPALPACPSARDLPAVEVVGQHAVTVLRVRPASRSPS